MSDSNNLIVVAQITGAFGVKGEARVRSFTADPEAAFTYGPLTDASGRVVLTPVKHRRLNEGFGVTTAEKKQREEWEAMRGTLLHTPRGAARTGGRGGRGLCRRSHWCGSLPCRWASAWRRQGGA